MSRTRTQKKISGDPLLTFGEGPRQRKRTGSLLYKCRTVGLESLKKKTCRFLDLNGCGSKKKEGSTFSLKSKGTRASMGKDPSHSNKTGRRHSKRRNSHFWLGEEQKKSKGYGKGKKNANPGCCQEEVYKGEAQQWSRKTGKTDRTKSKLKGHGCKQTSG